MLYPLSYEGNLPFYLRIPPCGIFNIVLSISQCDVFGLGGQIAFIL